jgi:hypothetical protein
VVGQQRARVPTPRRKCVKTDDTSATRVSSKVDKTVSIHAKFKFLAVVRLKSSRFAPLNGPRGAESGDHLQFELSTLSPRSRYGLQIEKNLKPYGVPIELPDPRIKKLLFVLTNPEARGNDFEFRKDMTARMYTCLDVSGDGKLSVQEVIQALGTPPPDPNGDTPKPVELAVLSKASLRGLNAWEVTRLLVLYLVERSWFNVVVTFIVLLNCVVLALDYHGIPDSMALALEPVNLVCTILFGVEMLLKIIGMGFARYASDTFNLFDGLLVILSLVELAL